ncbi:cysteine proteinase [Trichodelitschia bisporula]|uniref:ubiquitinyl hydrolase 1 n=1 Tax=Trichodelitschia bisporula TaxID=703511 RepID=A0A6G1HUW6_9PEZI|nr:cysteine proteinase [Trichodelitschia bisporula]
MSSLDRRGTSPRPGVSPAGKIAPLLIATIKTADRAHTVGKQRHPFTHPPRGYDEAFDDTLSSQAPPEQCLHRWTIKPNQSVLPDQVNEEEPNYKLACICQNCRWHLDIVFEVKQSLCLTREYPLHHFVNFQVVQSSVGEWLYGNCSVCSSVIHIKYRPPRLLPEDVKLLTDPALLQERFEDAKAADPGRELHKAATAVEVLDALAAYLRDCQKPSPERKQIPVGNKRFLISFGIDCNQVLTKLGFAEGVSTWSLPELPPPEPWADDTLRTTVEDAQEEAWALMRKFEMETKLLMFKGYRARPPPFDNEVNRVLGTAEYQAVPRRRRSATLAEVAWYEGLGALPDFPDSFLRYAFERQVAHDPAGSPYYFDCLQKIATKRDSEELNITLATLASEGYFGRNEVASAYKYFLLDTSKAQTLSDDYIRNVFETRLASAPTSQESEIRAMLKIIGEDRNSQQLQDAAANVVKTYEQALKWLDSTLDSSVADEYIITLAATRIGDRPSDQETCRNVVRVIAEERNSDFIRNWLITGEVQPEYAEDELTSAYKFFQINERNSDLSLEVLETVRQVKVLDDPHLEKEARKHYEVLLRHITGTGAMGKPDYANPVGLSNMGNTCYLNSLLQYFFALTPLRKIILDFDSYKMALSSTETFQPKKVGGREISRREVEKTQEFVTELRDLFRDMASAPGPVVNPSWRLAGLALAQDGTVQRRMTLMGNEHPLGSPKEKADPIFQNFVEVDGKSRHSSSPVTVTITGDDSSEITLVGDPVLTPDSDDEAKEEADDSSIVLVPPSSQNIEERPDPESMDQDVPITSIEKPAPPSRPPPVPPRPQNAPKLDGWREKAEDAAQQQDVAEVIDNVLFKIQCAIKPTSLDKDGAQMDSIQELFYGKYLWTYSDQNLEDKEEAFNTLFLNLVTKPRDVYAALDGFFDVEHFDVDGKTTERFATITQLPPILQVYFHRQQFDTEKGESYVIKHHVQLEETLYMDRYTSATPELRAAREHSWKLKEQIKQLQDRREKLTETKCKLPAPDVLDATYEFLSELGDFVEDAQELQEGLKMHSARRRKDLQTINDEINECEVVSSSMFEGLKKFGYQLSAVFFHRGQGGMKGGHYWVYIHDFKGNVWRRYEDREVTVVRDLSQIFGESDPAIQGAPYFVVYVRDDLKNKFVDAVCRHEPEPTGSDGDVDMTDAEDSGAAIDEADPTSAYHG